ELLVSEERIDNVNTALSIETIGNRLKQLTCSVPFTRETNNLMSKLNSLSNECRRNGTLDCGHDFHIDCIKQWLMLKNWCPICKTTGAGLASK
ncbi:Probable E3 ubiquitin-protein ligase RHG1A, partial [Linum perenne]